MLYGVCKELGECGCGLCAAISGNKSKPILAKPWWEEDEPEPPVKVRIRRSPKRANFALGRLSHTKIWIRGGAETCGWCGYIHDPSDDCEEALPNCSAYRSSRWMIECKVCSNKHELPETPAQRWAFKWYPQVPTNRAISQWKRRTRENVIRKAYAAEQAMGV